MSLLNHFTLNDCHLSDVNVLHLTFRNEKFRKHTYNHTVRLVVALLHEMRTDLRRELCMHVVYQDEANAKNRWRERKNGNLLS